MKKILSFITFITLGFCSYGADLEWIGDGDGESFSDPLNWEDIDNLDADDIPDADDHIIVSENSFFINVDGDFTVASMDIAGGSRTSRAGYIYIGCSIEECEFFNTGSLTVTGDVISNNVHIYVTNGSLTAQNMDLEKGSLIVESGNTATINEDLILSNAASTDVYGTLELGGEIPSGSLSTFAGSLLVLNGTATQTIPNGTYENVELVGGTKSIPSGTVVFTDLFTANDVLVEISGTGSLELDGISSSVDFGTSTISYTGDDQSIPTYSSDYYDLKISGTGTKTLLNDLTTSNDVIITSGGLLLIDDETLEVQGNFTNDGTFTKGEGTVVFTGSEDSEINGSSITNFNNVTISKDADKTLTINSAVNICPTGTLTLTSANDDLAVGTGTLTLEADATGFARVAELLDGSEITGEVTVQAYINSTTRRWWQLTNSVETPTAKDWIDDIFVTGDFSGNSNAFLSGTDKTSMYTYNEAHADAPVDSGWAAFPAGSDGEIMPVGTGFRIFIRDDLSAATPKTLSVTGALNQGEINIPMTYTDKGSDDDDGWNLLGNPYASSIDGSVLSTTNDAGLFDKNIYVWNSAAKIYDVSPAVIAPHQAFFIQSNGVQSTFDLTESMKTAGGTLLRQAPLGNEIHISLFDENENETFNYAETSIFVNANATSEFDKPYEASFLSRNMFNSDNTEDVVDIATRLESGKRLKANHIPESDDVQEIPLYVEYSSAKKYTLQVSLKDYEYGEKIVLVDNYTNEETKLDGGEITKEITFTDDEASRASDRFTINVNAPIILGTNDFDSNSGIMLYPNPANEVVNITVLSAYSDVDISISDLSGNVVYTESVKNSDSSFSQAISTEGLEAGIYFVSVTSNGSTHSDKLVINK